MALQPGTRLGPYEIQTPLGAGGMGEVYRARDRRLDRDVAIKVLPEHVRDDEILRQRFEREARVISKLQHPGLCALHDIGSEEGVDFLVMELLEGETLQDRLHQGPLPLARALEIGREIAEGIDAAHRAGVAHRDLKPGNVMLTRAGVKVLDFGLARKVLGSLDPDGRTATMPLTEEGSLIGTVPYMAPEQLQTGSVDARSDLWALGCILHEMIAGERPFVASSRADLIAAILTSEPKPPSLAREEIPHRFDWVVARCLEKDPERRWQSARDLAIELRAIEEGPSGPLDAAVRTEAGAPRPARALLLVAALAAALLAGGLLGRLLSRGDAGAEQRQSEAEWRALAVDSIQALGTASPDGRWLVIHQDGRLRRRPVGSLVWTAIPGGEGTCLGISCEVSFSPDGTRIVYRNARDSTVAVLPLEGGTPRIVAEHSDPSMRFAWGFDGYIYYGERDDSVIWMTPDSSILWRVPEDGGAPERVGRGFINSRSLVPGGKLALTFAQTDPTDGRSMVVRLLDLESGDERTLGRGSHPRYLDPGFAVYFRDGSLWAVPFDPSTGELTGTERPIESGVKQHPSLDLSLDWQLAGAGDLAYIRDAFESDRRRLVWVDRAGRVLGELSSEHDRFLAPRLAPTGDQVSVQIESPTSGGARQARLDLGSGFLAREGRPGTFNGSDVWRPPSGDEVLFSSNRDGEVLQVYRQAADGSGRAERLAPTDNHQIVLDVDPSGDVALLLDVAATGDLPTFQIGVRSEILRVDLETGARSSVSRESAPSVDFHPNGRWFAVSSGRAGAARLSIRSASDTGQRLDLDAAGQEVLFSPDGSELYYVWGSDFMAIPIEIVGNRLVPGPPERLFADRFSRFPIPATGIRNYDVHPDGRFLMIQPVERTEETHVYVENWRAKVIAAFAED